MSKWSRVLVTIAAVIMLLTAALHLVGHFSPTPPPANETEETLWELVSTYEQDVLGTPRTLMDFLKGFSLNYSLLFAFAGAMTLVVLRMRPDDARLGRAVVIVDAAAMGAALVISLRFFFLVPTVLTSLALLALLAALVLERGPGLAEAAET